MTVYLESSAVLCWLLGQINDEKVIEILNSEATFVTSVLTKLEVERSISRAVQLASIKQGRKYRLWGMFKKASSHWFFCEILSEILERAGQDFPVEPVRALDAIHLASILKLFEIYPDIRVLSFDRKILDNLSPLGIDMMHI